MRKTDPVKHEEKRREILAVAARCFGRAGLHGASISQICAEAGMSAGHLYHYFPSKESILEAMVEANLKRAATIFAGPAEGESVLETLVVHLDHSAPDDQETVPLLFDIFAEAGRNPAMAEILGKHSQTMHGLLADLLRGGQERGEIDPDLDPEVVAPVLISLVDGSKALRLRSPQLGTHCLTDVFRTLVSRFLAAPQISE